MRDSDWSRQILLRSDWLGPFVAICTTEYHVARVAGAGFLVGFIDRAREKRARPGTFVVKSLKKTVACYADLISIM